MPVDKEKIKALAKRIADPNIVKEVLKRKSEGKKANNVAVSREEDDLIGPPVPREVAAYNNTKKMYEETYDDIAKKYDEKYPNIAYFIRNSGRLRGERYGRNDADWYRFDPDSTIDITGTKKTNVPVDKQLLDKFALYGAQSGVSPYIALGLPAQESRLGFYPPAFWGPEGMRAYTEIHPRGYALDENGGGTTPIELFNDSAYTNEPYGSTISYVAQKLGVGYPDTDSSYSLRGDLSDEELSKVEAELAKGRAYADSQAKKLGKPGSIFEHAYNLYKSGKYNPGDPNHSSDVENSGKDLFSSPEILDWWKSSGRKYYEQYAPDLLNGLSCGGSLLRKYEDGGGPIGEDDPNFIGPVTPRSVRIDNEMRNVSDKYMIAKGDTLSKIAQRVYGDPMKYTLLANVNGIDNPDVIYPGQEIVIPKKFDKPLKKSEIPTKNVVRVIDNYSPNYNYIVEGDKVYYSVKGKDYWVDISDNEKARKNLLNFLGDKYNFRGYEDDEDKIRRRVDAGNFNYDEYRDSLNKVATGKTTTLEQAIGQQKNSIVPEYDPSFSPSVENGFYAARDNTSLRTGSVQDKGLIIDQSAPVSSLESILATAQSDEPKVAANKATGPEQSNDEEAEISDLEGLRSIYREEGLPGVVRTAKNGISRRLDKLFMNNEEVAAMEPPTADLGNSEYGLLPVSFTGDTLRYRPGVLPREYFIPESIDMTSSQFGTRNRGDLTELNTEGAVITTFNAFKPYEESNVSDDRTYIGVDSSGNFKVGNGSEFGPGDKLTRTYANDVYDFAKDKNGNYKFKSDARHGNVAQNVALVNVKDEKTGEIKESGALNILVGKNDTSGSTYGSITGGRVLVKVGNEIRLLSGSIQQIESEFNAMKQRQHTDHGTFYTLDNGSFNKALRTYDKKLTKGDLSNYDKKNTSGGNFMYLLPGNVPSKYPQDTVYSPNVRTEKDESYRKGHPLKNANKGVVLHYTAFPETNDMTAVTNHFMNPRSEASAHLLITPNGARRVFADEDQVAFHAGYSSFNGVDDVNDFMHGIEFQASGPNVPLTKDQIDSAVEYLERYIRKYNIPLENIVSHEAVRDAWLNSHSEQEARRKGVQRKQDLSPMQMKQIIDALKERVYYKKAEGGFLNKLGDGSPISDALNNGKIDLLRAAINEVKKKKLS